MREKFDNDRRGRRKKESKTDTIVLEVRDYPSLITKLRIFAVRSCVINIVDPLSEICEVRFTARTQKGGKESGCGSCEGGSRGCANAPSREPTVFTPSAKCRNRAYQFALFIHVIVLHIPPPARVLRIGGFVYVSTGSVLGHAPTIARLPKQ